MNADPFDKYVRLRPVLRSTPGTPGERETIADEAHDWGKPMTRAFAPALDGDAHPAPPRVWPGGVRTLGPLLLIPGRSVHVEDIVEAEQLHQAIGEAIAHLHREFHTAGVSGD